MSNYLNMYQFRDNCPEGFNPVNTAGGHFVHAIDQIPTPEDIAKARENNKKSEIKYYLVLAQQHQNRSVQTIDTAFTRYKCTEEEFRYFSDPKIKAALHGHPVYLSYQDGSWGTERSSGIWYQYISDSLRRYDGKPLDFTVSDLKK